MFELKKEYSIFIQKSVFSTNFQDTSLKNCITSLAAVAEKAMVCFFFLP